MPSGDFPRVRQVVDAAFVLDQAIHDAPEEPALRVTLPEPMLRYACNQQGCCCSGWRITLKPRDLVRLGRYLPALDRPKLLQDIGVMEEIGPDGQPTITEAYITDEAGRCRFLASDEKRCSVHAAAGVDALPDICVDFPVVAYTGADGPEFAFDPVCPSVLDAIAATGAPTRGVTVEPPYPDDGFRRRAGHARPFPVVRFGVASLTSPEFVLIRNRVVASLQDTGRPVEDHLRAIDEAYAQVGRGERRPSELELRYEGDPAPYARFFRECLGAHGVGTLSAVFDDYRRFIFAIPVAPGSGRWDELDKHLRHWEAAAHRWLEPEHDALRPLQLSYLAHRHFTPFLTIQGELHFSAGAIVHTFATALRYAAAFGAVLRRPVDRDIMKAALGTAEFVYRSLEIPPQSLPWYGLST